VWLERFAAFFAGYLSVAGGANTSWNVPYYSTMVMTVFFEPLIALSAYDFVLVYSGLEVGIANDVRKDKGANNDDNNFGWGEIKCIVDFNEVFHFTVLVVRSIRGKAIHVFW
jgi:hypothetical protein